MKPAIRVAVYARVSTVNGGQNPETQLLALREYCEQRSRRGLQDEQDSQSWQIIEEYVDHGVSGAKESRPALNRLMLDAKARKFDVVLVWKLDRFGRSLRHLVNSLAEFEAVGVAFVSLTDNLDMTTPQGRLMFHVIGAMAEFERALIRERVKVGMKRAKALGHRPGVHRFELDLDTIELQIQSGASLREVAKLLNVSPALISKRLKERRDSQ